MKRGKVDYPGHALHRKTVTLRGKETPKDRRGVTLASCWRCVEPTAKTIILIPETKVRLLKGS